MDKIRRYFNIAKKMQKSCAYVLQLIVRHVDCDKLAVFIMFAQLTKIELRDSAKGKPSR